MFDAWVNICRIRLFITVVSTVLFRKSPRAKEIEICHFFLLQPFPSMGSLICDISWVSMQSVRRKKNAIQIIESLKKTCSKRLFVLNWQNKSRQKLTFESFPCVQYGWNTAGMPRLVHPPLQSIVCGKNSKNTVFPIRYYGDYSSWFDFVLFDELSSVERKWEFEDLSSDETKWEMEENCCYQLYNAIWDNWIKRALM